jgi:hypothetical protein
MDMVMDAWTDPGLIIGIHQPDENREIMPIASTMHENAMSAQQVLRQRSGSAVDSLASLSVKPASL